MELTEKGKEARRKYQAEWLAKNKAKRADTLAKYWERKAEENEQKEK